MASTLRPDDPPAASVVICTRDRAESLARTLRSLVAASREVAALWELIVVDNGSTDHTRAIVEGFAAELPVRLVREERAGLSNARNAGVAAARGGTVIWTDDDVEVDAGWLGAYLAAFERHPEASLFGGRALPYYEEPQQPWFIRAAVHLQSMLAVRDCPNWTTITPRQLPYGLNYAVRLAEQRRHLYDPELGVAPGRRRGGEETAVVEAILAEGGTGVWVWNALVHHLIPARRQTLRYIYEFYRAHGYDFPVIPLDSTPGGAMPRLVAIALRRSLAAVAKWIVGEPSWVRSFVELARTLGTIDRVWGDELGSRAPLAERPR